MRKNKKQKGFTLVEVIVVAVIVAVLAAVAIPLYNGYIRDSRDNVCENTAATIASAYVAAAAVNQTPGITGQTVTVPSASGINSTIDIPVGYTATASGGVVTVNGPGGSTASVNYQ